MSRVYLENFIVGASSNPTRKQLEVRNMNESTILKISDVLASKICKYAAKKYESLDFGSIEKSKGDLSKVTELETVIKILDVVQLQNKNESVLADIMLIKNTIDNIRHYKKEFMEGFDEGIGLLKMIYSCAVKGIIEYTTWICISAFDINSINNEISAQTNARKQNEYFRAIRKSLEDTNSSIERGDLDKIVKELQKNKVPQQEEVVMSSLIIGISVAIGFILAIRLAIVAFYSLKMKLKDFLEIQIALLDANINSGNIDDKVKAKQKKILENLVKLKSKLEHETNKVNPEKETKKEDQDIETKDIDF